MTFTKKSGFLLCGCPARGFTGVTYDLSGYVRFEAPQWTLISILPYHIKEALYTKISYKAPLLPPSQTNRLVFDIVLSYLLC